MGRSPPGGPTIHEPGDQDDDCMARTAAGDREAFGELVRRHQERAWRIAWKLAHDPESAADLVQDAFLRILEGASRYRPEGRFPAFLRTVLVRRHLDLSARRRALPLGEEEEPAAPDPGPEGIGIEGETRSELAQALTRLAPDQRAAVVLRHYEDLGYQEIAEVLETTPKAVEMLLRRGRERLARLLGAEPPAAS